MADDPWLPERLRRDEVVRAGEGRIQRAARKALAALLRAIGVKLKGNGYDASHLDTRMAPWRDAVEADLMPAIREVFEQAFNEETSEVDQRTPQGGSTSAPAGAPAQPDTPRDSRSDDADQGDQSPPAGDRDLGRDRSTTRSLADLSPEGYVKRHLQEVENHLVEVADDVFDVIRRELEEGRQLGEDIPTLAARVDDVLYQSGTDWWDGRSTTIARTEVISAYNAGRYGAAEAIADLRGFDPEDVEKGWLDTPDERTRLTHRRGTGVGGDWVRLHADFTVGGFPAKVPGDSRLPAKERVNCRCTPLFRYPGDPGYGEVPLVAAGNEEPTGSCIVGLVSADDPLWQRQASDGDDLHVTMVWMGATGEPTHCGTGDDVGRALVDTVGRFEPFTVQVAGQAVLGPDKLPVVLVESEHLVALRNDMIADGTEENGVIGCRWSETEQWPTWIPHITVAEGTDLDGITEITIDRLGYWDGPNHYEYTLGAPNVDDATTAAGYLDPEPPADPADVEIAEIPWHGVLAPEGVMSGDRRMFSPNALTHRPLPLPLPWMPDNQEGHNGAIPVARIDDIRRIPQPDGTNLIVGWGYFHAGTEAVDTATGQLANGIIRGVSVDLDDTTMEWVNADGDVINDRDPLYDPEDPAYEPNAMVVTAGRISAATLCAIPAFAEAWVQIGEPPAEWLNGWSLTPEQDAIDASEDPATAFRSTVQAAGEGRIPEDLGDYWVHGEGAAKIGWGTPGDFNRCRVQLAKYVRPDQLSGLCANLHKRALGKWPGQENAAAAVDFSKGHAITPQADDCDECGAAALVASAGAMLTDFSDPQLSGVTPMTITDDGRIFGHLADWTTCHIGFKGCRTAPHSNTNYSWFHTGLVKLGDGTFVPVGQITVGTGHAGNKLRAAAAIDHYDHTGTAVADICVGEDAHGIWYAGRMREDVTDKQLAELRAAAVSGDWRPHPRGLELVAALGVNVPGFPIPRQAAHLVNNEVRSLVAAGVVRQPREPESIAAIIAATIKRMDAVRSAHSIMRAASLQEATLIMESTGGE